MELGLQTPGSPFSPVHGSPQGGRTLDQQSHLLLHGPDTKYADPSGEVSLQNPGSPFNPVQFALQGGCQQFPHSQLTPSPVIPDLHVPFRL